MAKKSPKSAVQQAVAQAEQAVVLPPAAESPQPPSTPTPGVSTKSWNLLRKIKDNPGKSALGGLALAGAAGTVADIGGDLFKELIGQVAGPVTGYESPGRKRQNAEVDAQIQGALNERKRQMDMQRLQQAAAQNAQLMMQMQPELYQKVVYGRSVPRGGRIIGGTQLPDALERLAASIPRGA
jgi:hypothetical protein